MVVLSVPRSETSDAPDGGVEVRGNVTLLPLIRVNSESSSMGSEMRYLFPILAGDSMHVNRIRVRWHWQYVL